MCDLLFLNIQSYYLLYKMKFEEKKPTLINAIWITLSANSQRATVTT